MKLPESKSEMMEYINAEIFSGKYDGPKAGRVKFVKCPYPEPVSPTIKAKWDRTCLEAEKWCDKIDRFDKKELLGHDLI